jgi:prepilin-type processing-associated H-X9-DG protein
MQPDLLGYVLNALDAPARAEVEGYIESHPSALAQVEALREALDTLSWDVGILPPPQLADRTVQRVEEAQVSKGPKWFGGARRLLTAAAVLMMAVTAGGVGVSWLGGLRNQLPGGQPNAVLVTQCKENLHKAFLALGTYGDHHDGQFPNTTAAAKPPRNAGGMVFSVLHDERLLPADFKLACPGTNYAAPEPISVADVQTMNELAYQGWAQSMQNGYAYSLGYHQGGQQVGPRLENGKPNSFLPLVADSSPPDPLGDGQSLNHGGTGQNVLYGDGHVAFWPTRYAGYNQDDIYLNRANKVAAGVDWGDAVLTSGAVPP